MGDKIHTGPSFALRVAIQKLLRIVEFNICVIQCHYSRDIKMRYNNFHFYQPPESLQQKATPQNI